MAPEVSSGDLFFKIVNVDDPENDHFVSDYKLSTRSVVLVNVVDSRQTAWKNLEEVWDLVDDKAAFQQYIKEETRAYLDSESHSVSRENSGTSPAGQVSSPVPD